MMPFTSAMIRTRPSSVIGYARSFSSCAIRLTHRPFGAPEPPQERVHFLLDPRNLAQTNLMDLVCCQIRRRESPQVVGVRRVASVESPQSGVIGRRGDERLEYRDGPSATPDRSAWP